VRITVLGKSPAWQDVGGACSGYLVESGATRLLVDCGPGVLAKLRAHCDYAEVEAVVFSHLHADHILDIVPFASALTFSPRGVAGELERPALHVPPGGSEHLAALGEAASMGRDHVAKPFAVREYDPDEELEVGELTLRFRAVPHYVPSHAIDVRDGRGRLTFSGDCGPNAGLCEFARDTGLLLVEATVPRPDTGDPRGHMTPREAGEHGARAGARRVVVTHYSDELDADWVRAEAAAGYGADVELAAEGAVYEVKLDPSAADAVK
jgi:ribonuclease BN (tRNA processing enzyme)